MNELISLTRFAINGEVQQTVNARELHAFLEVGKVFATWIKNRLDTLGSIEGQDYLILKGESLLPQTGKQTNDGRGGHNRLEYFVTLDTAKHLAMMERNEKGMQARKYFIECEKKLREVSQPQPVQPIGEVEDKLRAIAFALDRSSLSSIAKETYIITSVETLTGVYLGYRPQIEQVTYSAKEVGDMLEISENLVGRIANAHGLKTEEYGSYYLSKSEHSDKQVEHFRYFEKAIDKFKSILGDTDD